MRKIAIVLAGCLLFNSCITFAGTASNKTARALIGDAIGMAVGVVVDAIMLLAASQSTQI